MQASYDESQARSDVGYAEDKPKTTTKEEYGNQDFKFQLPDLPLT